jgi:hypothetical protein
MSTQSTQSPPHQPSTKAPLVLRECAICQSSIHPTEQIWTCPKCSLVYHAECWQSNMGCATYGCDQVNALAPKEEDKPAPPMQQPIVEAIEPLPWSFLLLGAATISLAIASLTYGIPSGVVLLLAGLRLGKKRHLRDRPLVWAAFLSFVGLIVGLFISWRIWFR